MEVTVEHLGEVKFSVSARSHTLICDQPADNGGGDEGMTPPELLISSLATCAGFYAVQYLKKFNLATTGVKVTVSAEKALNPARLENFVITVHSPVALDEKHRAGVERSVHHCLIHNTLLAPPRIELRIEQ